MKPNTEKAAFFFFITGGCLFTVMTSAWLGWFFGVIPA